MTRRLGILCSLLVVGLSTVGCGAGHAAGLSVNAAASSDDAAGMMPAGPGLSYARLSCAAPSSLPGQRVDVTLADMGMTRMMAGIAPMGSRMMLHAGPVTVAAGTISVVASNVGWRTHELVILPLTSGATAGRRTVGPDGKVPEQGSLGEASGSCAAGAGLGIPAGEVGWVTVTLVPGRYELVCNLQNHYADGMHQELLVT